MSDFGVCVWQVDLVVTPVLTEDKRIDYRASALVTAAIRGGIVLLDEGNRMPERSWASLAPLMDDRRAHGSAAESARLQFCVRPP